MILSPPNCVQWPLVCVCVHASTQVWEHAQTQLTVTFLLWPRNSDHVIGQERTQRRVSLLWKFSCSPRLNDWCFHLRCCREVWRKGVCTSQYEERFFPWPCLSHPQGHWVPSVWWKKTMHDHVKPFLSPAVKRYLFRAENGGYFVWIKIETTKDITRKHKESTNLGSHRFWTDC